MIESQKAATDEAATGGTVSSARAVATAPDGVAPDGVPSDGLPPGTGALEAAVPDDVARRIAAVRRRAAAVLVAERLWRAAIWPLGVVGLYVGLAWIGALAALPDWARVSVVALLGLAFVASFAAFLTVRRPGDAAALDRAEAASGLAGRPLHGLADRLSRPADAASTALWRAHRARLAQRLPALRSGVPHPGLARADRYALRPLLAMLLFVGYMAAGDQRLERLRAGIAGPRPVAVEPPRLDAWVTPPAYTGKAAFMLSGERAVAPDSDGTHQAPAGSIVAVRMARSADAPGPAPRVVLRPRPASPGAPTGAATGTPTGDTPTTVAAKAGATALVAEFETPLAADAELAVETPGDAATAGVTPAVPLATWRFRVTPDLPPTITLTQPPQPQLTGALKLDYTLADDYGVTGATALVTAPTAAAAKPPRSLVPPPDFSLGLPQAKGRIGAASTIRDLTQHPWAGARVRLTLEASDEAGQVGRSEPVDLVLPAKPLTKPLARAIVEQRRTLALDADSAATVAMAIDALMIAPDKFITETGHFFGLKLIERALARARTDDDLRGVMDLMWTVARQIEDGDLTDAEKALREAQENLRKAIEQGAPEQDIARLTNELRKAMDRYLAEMAQQMRQNPQTARSDPGNTRTMRKQDLDRMLKRIEDLARTGSREAAQQLLNQLQQMLENMQAGRPRQSPNQQGDSRMSELLDKLGDLLQRQQDLYDRTFKADPRSQQQQSPRGQRPQRGQQPPQRPMTADELADLLKQLEKGQGEAQQALKDLMEGMDQEGLGDGEGDDGKGGARDKLGEAGEAMGRAGKALGRGRAGEALGPEGEALDSLRQGAQGLMRELARRQGQPGNGPGEGQGQTAGREDPLGRPRAEEGPDFSDSVKIPGEIDAERARKILEDIRGRLSQQTRPKSELDYLDRLLLPQ
jgi:uncharacterized protein (TIGR02302 family)